MWIGYRHLMQVRLLLPSILNLCVIFVFLCHNKGADHVVDRMFGSKPSYWPLSFIHSVL